MRFQAGGPRARVLWARNGSVGAAEPYRLRIGWVVAEGDSTLDVRKTRARAACRRELHPDLIHFEAPRHRYRRRHRRVDAGRLPIRRLLGVINAGWTICGSSPTASGWRSATTNGYLSATTARSTVGDLGKSSRRTSGVARSTLAVRAMLAKHNMGQATSRSSKYAFPTRRRC